MGLAYRFRWLAMILAAVITLAGVAATLFYSFASTASTKTYTYQASSENFPNPERGFFNERVVYYTSNWSGAGGLSTSDLAGIQQSGNRVVLVYYILSNFASTESPEQTCSQPYVADEPLPQDFLAGVNNDLAKIRSAGLKVILRFAYNFDSGLPDAPLCRILGHIAQLGPVLQQNVDVIDLLEAGFVGAWGEWHDSTNGLLTADADGVDQINSASQLIVNELLKVLPQQRMLAMRYPRFTMELDGTTSLTASQAFSGTNQARMGAHDDCFLDGDDEGGTFQESSSATVQSQQTFLQQDNQYVPQVGETCAVAAPNTNCPNALTELAQYHYSALNKDYNTDVLSGWTSQGCISQIQEDLGYRFRLTQSVIPTEIAAGQTLNMSFNVANDGWANLYNPRDLELVLRNQQNSSEQYTVTLNNDPRTWLSGKTTTVNVSVAVPSDMVAGTYNLYLNLPDPASSLHTNPAYSIQLANTGAWDAQTGYNSLQASLQVVATAGITPTVTSTATSVPTPTATPTATSVPTRAPTPTAAANLLVNGSFEARTLAPWYFYVGGSAAGSLALDHTVSKNGHTSAHITVTQRDSTNYWNVELEQPDLSLTQGRTYTISFWAKASQNRPGQVCVQLNAVPWTQYLLRDFALSTTWTKYAYTFTAPTTVADALFDFDLAQSTGSVWLDSVSVVSA